MSAQRTSFSPLLLVIGIYEPRGDLFVCVAGDYDYDVFVITRHPQLNISQLSRHSRFPAVILTSVNRSGFLLAENTSMRPESIALLGKCYSFFAILGKISGIAPNYC